MLSGNMKQVIGEDRKRSQNKLNIVGTNGGWKSAQTNERFISTALGKRTKLLQFRRKCLPWVGDNLASFCITSISSRASLAANCHSVSHVGFFLSWL